MHMGHSAANPGVDFPGGKTQIFGAEGDVLGHRFLKQLILWILKHQPHLLPDAAAVGAGGVEVLAVDENLPAGGLQQTVEVLHQGGLARPGVSHHGNKFAVFNGQAHIADGRGLEGAALGIGMGHVLQFDGHKSLATSSAISSTVRISSRRGMPPSRRSFARAVMWGTSR